MYPDAVGKARNLFRLVCLVERREVLGDTTPDVLTAIRLIDVYMLFLPPHRPDVNLFEQSFAKIKRLLRNTASLSREALWRVVGEFLHAIEQQKCANSLRNAGHAQELVQDSKGALHQRM